MLELVEEQRIPIPRYLMRMALSMMRRSVRKRAKFNIDELAPVDTVGSSFIPALFGELQLAGETILMCKVVTGSGMYHVCYALLDCGPSTNSEAQCWFGTLTTKLSIDELGGG